MNLKKLLFLFFLMYPLFLTAQTEEKPQYAPRGEKHRNVTDEFGQKQGTWKFYGRTDGLQFEIDYVNNRKEGNYKSYYIYGEKVKEECSYKNNKKDGEYKYYYPNGQVKLEGAYNYGKKDGKWTRYYDDGTVKQEFGFKNGLPDGTWKWFDVKGQQTGVVEYKDGVNLAVKAEQEKRKAELEQKKAQAQAGKKPASK